MVVGSIASSLMRNMDQAFDPQKNTLLKQLQEIPSILTFFIVGKCRQELHFILFLDICFSLKYPFM